MNTRTCSELVLPDREDKESEKRLHELLGGGGSNRRSSNLGKLGPLVTRFVKFVMQ